MKDRIILFLLFIYIIGLTFIHNSTILISIGVVALLLSWKVAIQSLKAIALFNISVTIGYIIKSIIYHTEFLDFIVMFNFRVFDIIFAVFYTIKRINLLKAFSFSKSLTFLLVATISQIESFKQSYYDFLLAFRSRTIKKLHETDKRKFISSMLYFFLQKSLHNSKERTLALKARGFFD